MVNDTGREQEFGWEKILKEKIEKRKEAKKERKKTVTLVINYKVHHHLVLFCSYSSLVGCLQADKA